MQIREDMGCNLLIFSLVWLAFSSLWQQNNGEVDWRVGFNPTIPLVSVCWDQQSNNILKLGQKSRADWPRDKTAETNNHLIIWHHKTNSSKQNVSFAPLCTHTVGSEGQLWRSYLEEISHTKTWKMWHFSDGKQVVRTENRRSRSQRPYKMTQDGRFWQSGVSSANDTTLRLQHLHTYRHTCGPFH